MSAERSEFYNVGGTLPVEARSYIEREADDELFQALRQGRFCYVLTSRQMGKSSLMKRAAQRLREAGVSVAEWDLSKIGKEVTSEQWYYGLMEDLSRQTGVNAAAFAAFWDANLRLGPAQRWQKALEQLILPAVSGDLVIFVDELDLARSLKFSADDFFAGIRACYNRRADEALWRRISFCLLGVVNPGDLIPDPLITPFNIGQRITLRDFTLAEAKPLAKGLGADPETNEKTLKRIIYWTNGQPYLTQRLCAEAAAQGARRRREIDRLCDELFFRARREKDPNLDFVGKRLAPPLSDLPGVEEAQYEEYLAGRLDLYRRVRAGARVPDEETRPHVSELRLSGVARAENGLLKVRNRIYEKAFGPSWIKDKAPKQAARWREALRVASLALMIVLMAGLTALAVSQWRRAVKAEGEAQKQAQEAQAQARKAEQTAALVQEQAQAAALNQKCSGRLAFLQTNANVYSRPLLSSGASREVRDSFLIAQHFKGAKLCIVDEAQNDLGNFWYKVRVLGYGTNSVNPSWYGKKLLRDTSPEEKDRSFYLQGDDDAPDIGWVKEMDNARGLRIVSF